MSSCLIGAGRNTAAAAAATYHEFEFLKSASASDRASPHSSSSSSCFTSSSPNSTLSESSNSICCRRKPRTPRKRPNQTYSEAAALLSTAYPNIFSSKHLTNPPSFKFSKPTCLDEEEILLPLLSKASEPRFGFVSNCWSEKPCESPMGFGDFDTESILDEEIEGGIDSIMGNLGVNEVEQTTTNFCYGIPMGLGLGFDFELGMSRGVSAFRNSPHTDDDWWRFPTVNVEQISPTLEKKKSSSCCSKKKKKLAEEKEQEEEVSLEASKSDSRIQLKLNYDHVLTAWSDRGSPFSHDFDLSPTDALTRLAQIDLFGENGGVREASVMRYKEKRRTRLFSKKIRYQVRKVNADQRPRMKGRFVRGSGSSVGAQQ